MLRFSLASLFFSLLGTVSAISVNSTVLTIGTDTNSTIGITIALKAYGIPYEVYTLRSNRDLPALNTTATVGKYGGIVMTDEALGGATLDKIYAYQKAFGVRFVRVNASPGPDTGNLILPPKVGKRENIKSSAQEPIT
jgi:hypothetical protein